MSTTKKAPPKKRTTSQTTKAAHAQGLAEGFAQGQAEVVKAIEADAMDKFFSINLELACANTDVRDRLELVYAGYEQAWIAAGGSQ